MKAKKWEIEKAFFLFFFFSIFDFFDEGEEGFQVPYKIALVSVKTAQTIKDMW